MSAPRRPRPRPKLAALVAAAVLSTGCGGVAPGVSVGPTASAELRDAKGQVVGQATFTEVSAGVRLVVDVRGLPPGEKGVHLHAVGQCEAPRFDSAGEHFNPENRQHGLLNPAGPHAGDLPNLGVAPNGTGRLETFSDRITLHAGAGSLFDADGTALVVHAAPDDFKTDPGGETGPRIACGVVVKSAAH